MTRAWSHGGASAPVMEGRVPCRRGPTAGPTASVSRDHVVCPTARVWAEPSSVAAAESQLELGLDGEREDGWRDGNAVNREGDLEVLLGRV